MLKTKSSKLLLSAGVLLATGAFLLADFTSVALAITQPYRTTDTSIKPGMVVAIATDDNADTGTQAQTVSPLVKKASQAKAELTVGIVTSWGQAQLSYSDGQSDEISVANSGRVQAYVSDVNGIPQAGDLLTPSPLAGILMRATDGAKGIVGSLATKFATDNVETLSLKDGKPVRVALLGIDMDVRSSAKISPQNNALQAFVKRLTGHEVSMFQIVVSLVVLMLAIIISGSICYAAVSNYLTAVGRNPLAIKQLKRSLWQMLGFAAVLFAIGLLSSWAVLWM